MVSQNIPRRFHLAASRHRSVLRQMHKKPNAV
ncbi:hypothetical protein M791_08520 [Neisseria gonorrhoeae MU_NG26]|nr:hypothetical protein M685_07500 [Neisseria gonorrhoeae SK16259]KLS38922.1 hypothetical protein M724_09590 [Neisseria gonorrhoeae ATL_2011_01_05]KLT08720.1 hypothetical protein M791_08520 [Neisseria gonorrhoeae MU_NG26]